MAATLSSDRDSYAAGDTATFTLELINDGATSVTDVEYRFELPEGVTLADGSQLNGFYQRHRCWQQHRSRHPGRAAGTRAGRGTGGIEDDGEQAPPPARADRRAMRASPPQIRTRQTPASRVRATPSPSRRCSHSPQAAASRSSRANACITRTPRSSSSVPVALATTLACGAMTSTAYAAETTQTLTCSKTVTVDGQDLTVQPPSPTWLPTSRKSPIQATQRPSRAANGSRNSSTRRIPAISKPIPPPMLHAPVTDIADSPYAEQIKTAYALGFATR